MVANAATGTLPAGGRSRGEPGRFSERRVEELASAEHVLVAVRWVAVVFAVVQVQIYAAVPYPPGARELGFGLAAALAATNVAAMVALRRPMGHRGTPVLAVSTLVADVAVVAGFVWVYTFDNSSVHFLLLFVLPAEAALKFRLAGAVGLWAALTVFYAGREAWGAVHYGYPVSVPSIAFRMGILLIVSLIVGLFAQRLGRRTDQLADALDGLEREERWRTTLIDMLAHDFRSPVGSATSALMTIEQRWGGLSEDAVRSLVDVAVRQNRRALALADDILAMARAGHDGLELHREDVELTPLFRRVARWLDADDSWVAIGSATDLRAFVDPARLEQLVTNLLSNARKHGRPPVSLDARPLPDRGVEIRVSDSGDGVPADRQDGLFGQFASGPRTDSVGLGLWLVAILAKAHGGESSYTTVAGRPTFVVRLPGVAADLEADAVR